MAARKRSHKYTKTPLNSKDKRKIYDAAPISESTKITVSKANRNNTAYREALIRSYLKKIDDLIDCPALGEKVIVMKKGKDETANKAKLSFKSTISVLNLKEALGNAVYIKPLPPKDNKNQACFRKMHLLICPIKRVGYAKIIVGEFFEVTKIPTKFAHYCITHISLKEIKG